MSKIFDLINELCPQGVEFRELGEICKFSRGKSLSKSDKDLGDIPMILYGELYTTYGDYINKIASYTSKERAQKASVAIFGDLILPISSTTKEAQIGKVSALMMQTPVYIGGDALILSHNQNPGFLVYYLNSKKFEKEKMKCVSGTTVTHLSPSKLAKIKVPVPPLEVQREIVRILDCFTLLTAELTAELTARKKQYEFYRDRLLSFDELNKNGGGCELKMLGEITIYPSDRIKFDSLNELNYVGVENLLQDKAGKISSKCVPNSGSWTKFENGDVLIGNIRPYLKKIWQADCTGGASGDVLVLRLNDENVNSRYLYQILADDKFFDYNMKHAKGAKMPRGNKNAILEYKIPIPPLSIQRKIVEILDKFDTLVNSISDGLPREIELRRKQYEYYRDLLLNFKEKSA